jgi:formylmethanofuran dehydrogenase subunit E
MLKKELAEKILESIDENAISSVNWNFKDEYIKAILKGLEDYEVIKKTHVHYCQSCGEDFSHGDIVYYAPIDNNIICNECAEEHQNKEIRIVD